MPRAVCQVCGDVATTATVDVIAHSAEVVEGDLRTIWVHDSEPYFPRCGAHARNVGLSEATRIREDARLAAERALTESPASADAARTAAETQRIKAEQAQVYADEQEKLAKQAREDAKEQAKAAREAQSTAEKAAKEQEDARAKAQADQWAAARERQDREAGVHPGDVGTGTQTAPQPGPGIPGGAPDQGPGTTSDISAQVTGRPENALPPGPVGPHGEDLQSPGMLVPPEINAGATKPVAPGVRTTPATHEAGAQESTAAESQPTPTDGAAATEDPVSKGSKVSGSKSKE